MGSLETEAAKRTEDLIYQVTELEMPVAWFRYIGMATCGCERGWERKFASKLKTSTGLVKKILAGEGKEGGYPISANIATKVFKVAIESDLHIDLRTDPPDLGHIDEASLDEIRAAIDHASKSDEELLEEMREGFEILETMVQGVLEGHFRGMIVSGPPGIGKTWPIQRAIEAEAKSRYMRVQEYATYVTGTIKATNLYLLLWEHRRDGLLVLDDCDAIWGDQDALNLLKGALDTTGQRFLSWRTEWAKLEELEIPKTFEFKGSVIFITNLNMAQKASGSSRNAASIAAVKSRSMFIPLNMFDQRSMLLRVEDMILNEKILRAHDKLDIVTAKLEREIVEFFQDNAPALHAAGALSLRAAVMVLDIITAQRQMGKRFPWQRLAKFSLCSSGGE